MPRRAPRVSNVRSFRTERSPHCTNEDAEEVREDRKANFCDYFVPSPEAHTLEQREAESRAEAELAALFGDEGSAAESASTSGMSKQDELARRRAESLFEK